MVGNGWLASLVGCLCICIHPQELLGAEVVRSGLELQKMATNIIDGRIKGIYRKKEKVTDDEGFTWERTNHVAEIEVEQIVKGEGIDKLKPVYVKYWSQRASGFFQVLGPTGQRGNITEGETVRIFLVRNTSDGYENQTDNALHVIGPNGFEKIPVPRVQNAE